MIVVCRQSVTRRIKELPLNGRPMPDTVDIDLLGTELKVGHTINKAIVIVCVCVCVCVCVFWCACACLRSLVRACMCVGTMIMSEKLLNYSKHQLDATHICHMKRDDTMMTLTEEFLV